MTALPSGTFQGSCHCGSVRFKVKGTLDDFTRCVKKNAVMYKVHESRLKAVHGEDKLRHYQWNTRVAQHYFGADCGIYTFHRKRAAPDHYGVNVFGLDGVDVSQVPVRRVDGKSMSLAGNC
ncbi:MAG: hypothetical protein JWN94_4154 [Betaproteobacteria bacterium]|nr:hypothetical protein [Betaproteobacteria bacterium]